MSTTDPRKLDAMHLRTAGRYAEALKLLGQLFDEADSEPAPNRNSYFMTMLEWQFLLEVYPPPRLLCARGATCRSSACWEAPGTSAARRVRTGTSAARHAFSSSRK